MTIIDSAEYDAAVRAAARGDADARARLPELRSRVDQIRAGVEADRATQADVDRIRAQDEAERARRARDQRQAALVEQRTDLEARMLSLLGDVEAGAFAQLLEGLAAVRDLAATQGDIDGQLEQIAHDRAVADGRQPRSPEGAFVARQARTGRAVGLVAGRLVHLLDLHCQGWRELATLNRGDTPLGHPVPVQRAAEYPDRKPHVLLEISGPNIRDADTAILPSALPAAPVGAR